MKAVFALLRTSEIWLRDELDAGSHHKAILNSISPSLRLKAGEDMEGIENIFSRGTTKNKKATKHDRFSKR